ncbi:MAG: cytochrome c3 family protein [Acidobacteriota bacterium]
MSERDYSVGEPSGPCVASTRRDRLGQPPRRRGGAVTGPLARGVILALMGLVAGCGGEDTAVSSGSSPAGARRAVIEAGYAGADACESCHQAQFDAWNSSRHRAIFREGDGPAWVASSPAPYRQGNVDVIPRPPGAAGGRASLTVRSGGAPGTFSIDAVIGGGRMEAYATRFDDGAWVLLPLYYQVDRHAFTDFSTLTCGAELIGGRAEVPRWQSYDRVWNHRCIACHVTAGSIGFDPATQEYSTRWTDAGVGCEACHGPGAEHVASARAGKTPTALFNPGRVSPGAAAQVCASCHGLALPFDSRWGGNRPYRPGDDYEAAFLPLLRPAEAGPFSRLAHVDRTPAVGVMEYQGLAQSRCALEGGLTCTTCHDPHGGGEAHQLRAPASAATLCTPCHQDVVDRGTEHTHHLPGRPGSNCVDCHMAPTVEALGTRLASHAIDIPLPVNNADFGAPDACSLCHADRGIDWAVAAFERLWGSPVDLRRRRLARVFNEEDADGLRSLIANLDEAPLLRVDGAYALARVLHTGAAPDLIQVLAEDPSLSVRRVAADLLGSIGPAAGTPVADQIRQQAVLDDAGVANSLGQAADAGPPSLRLAAAAALARLDTKDGLRRLEALRAVPELDGGYRLHQLLGKYHLIRQEFPEAEAEFGRVLEMTPNYLPVIEDLGFIYFTTNRFQQAHDLWSRGLALNPDSQDLKLKIHLAEDEMNVPVGSDDEAGGGTSGSR